MTGIIDVTERLDRLDQQFGAWTARQDEIQRARDQEKLRTLKPVRSPLYIPGQGQPGVPAAVGTTFLLDPGPVDEGFAWDVRIISGKLSANDSVAAFIGSNAQGMMVGYAGPPGAPPGQNVFVILIPKSSGILNGGEALFLQTSGTGNITQVRVSGWLCAGPEIGKLF